jgi:hypothetical protein
MLTASAGLAQVPALPPPPVPADTRWAPPPPLPSAAAPAPYRPLVPTAPPGTAATRPVLTLQKPAGQDAPQPDPKAPADPAEPKKDRDPPKAAETGGDTDKQKLFRLEADPLLFRRITRELYDAQVERDRRSPPDAAITPVTPAFFTPPPSDPLVPAGTRYVAKTASYPGGQALLEPGYVIHRRLYFEELNSERHGWEVGIAQPALSTLLFWKDTVLWPAKLASNCLERYDASAGKCPPGSPVPYYYYPEQVDLFGLAVGAGAIVGVAAVLP